MAVSGIAFAFEWSRQHLPLLLHDRQVHGRGVSAALAALRALLSALLMLIMMTLNGWLILAVVLGAAAGQYRYYEADEDDGYEHVALCH